jgi:hypothetical protein
MKYVTNDGGLDRWVKSDWEEVNELAISLGLLLGLILAMVVAPVVGPFVGFVVLMFTWIPILLICWVIQAIWLIAYKSIASVEGAYKSIANVEGAIRSS